MSDDNAGPSDEVAAPSTMSTARRAVRRNLSRVKRRLVRAGADIGLGRSRRDIAALTADVARLEGERDALAADLEGVRGTVTSLTEAQQADRTRLEAELTDATRRTEHRLDGIGAELSTVRDFGKVLSSARGWEGAADAFDELTFILHDLRRSVRDLSHARPSVPAEETSMSTPSVDDGGETSTGLETGAGPTDPYAGRHPERFDYLGFERRFRGSIEDVSRVLIERYADELESRGPVVDIGCGRGELLAELSRRGVDVIGVEPHEPSAAEARSHGLTVYTTTASEFLRRQPPHSLGAIISLHVVEHLVTDDLIEMLELGAKALKPGGVFIAETPNPMTVLTLHESYIMDPTHIHPIHPALMTFLTERAGFNRSEIRYHSPASTLWLEHVASESDPSLAASLNRTIDRLNHQLYGPQDYAVWAYTPTRSHDDEAALSDSTEVTTDTDQDSIREPLA